MTLSPRRTEDGDGGGGLRLLSGFCSVAFEHLPVCFDGVCRVVTAVVTVIRNLVSVAETLSCPALCHGRLEYNKEGEKE